MKLLLPALAVAAFCSINTAYADDIEIDSVVESIISELAQQSLSPSTSLSSIAVLPEDPVERCHHYINKYRRVCGPTKDFNASVCTTVYKLMTDWCNKAVGIQ